MLRSLVYISSVVLVALALGWWFSSVDESWVATFALCTVILTLWDLIAPNAPRVLVFKSLLVAILAITSWYLVEPLPRTSLPLLIGSNIQAWKPDEATPSGWRFPIGKVVGAALNMDWYDLCLENHSHIATGRVEEVDSKNKNRVEMSMTDFKISHSIFIVIFPTLENIERAAISKFDANLDLLPPAPRTPSSSLKGVVLEALPGGVPKCRAVLTTEGGFLYKGLFVVRDENRLTWVAAISSSTVLKLSETEPDEIFELNQTEFFVKPNPIARAVKFLTIFLLLIGSLLLIVGAYNFVRK